MQLFTAEEALKIEVSHTLLKSLSLYKLPCCCDNTVIKSECTHTWQQACWNRWGWGCNPPLILPKLAWSPSIPSHTNNHVPLLHTMREIVRMLTVLTILTATANVSSLLSVSLIQVCNRVNSLLTVLPTHQYLDLTYLCRLYIRSLPSFILCLPYLVVDC